MEKLPMKRDVWFALEGFKLRADENTVMLDCLDTPISFDVVKACAYGINTVWYERFAHSMNDWQIAVDRKVSVMLYIGALLKHRAVETSVDLPDGALSVEQAIVKANDLHEIMCSDRTAFLDTIRSQIDGYWDLDFGAASTVDVAISKILAHVLTSDADSYLFLD